MATTIQVSEEQRDLANQSDDPRRSLCEIALIGYLEEHLQGCDRLPDRLTVCVSVVPGEPLTIPANTPTDQACVLVHVDDHMDRVWVVGWAWGFGSDAAITVPRLRLKPPPLPVWGNEIVLPRSAEDQVQRRRTRGRLARQKRSPTHGLVCPRCGWYDRNLVVPYHPSKFDAYGGICSECCFEAAKRYDRDGWPEPRASMLRDENVSDKERVKVVRSVFRGAVRVPRGSKIHEGQEVLDVDSD